MKYTDENLAKMTLEDAMNEIENKVYEATSLLESLEYTKCSEGSTTRKLLGNGHHARQEASKIVSALLKDRWKCNEEDENKVFCPHCGEEFNEEDGLECENGEAVCSDDCLSEYDVS